MREVFHDTLEEIQSRLVEISELVAEAIEKATQAFATGDVALAEEVIANDITIDELVLTTDEIAIATLAMQQPVAHDLRVIVSALRVRRRSSAWATSPTTSLSSCARATPSARFRRG